VITLTLRGGGALAEDQAVVKDIERAA